MRYRTRIAASGIALLLASLLITPSADAEWDDGYWPLDFSSQPRQKSSDSSRAYADLYTLLKTDSQAILSVEIFLLDGDLGVVNVETDRELKTFAMSAQELMLVVEIFEEAGFELVAATTSQKYLLALQLILF